VIGGKVGEAKSEEGWFGQVAVLHGKAFVSENRVFKPAVYKYAKSIFYTYLKKAMGKIPDNFGIYGVVGAYDFHK